MVSHFRVTWHSSDMLVYMAIIFISESCDLSVFRRLRNFSCHHLAENWDPDPDAFRPSEICSSGWKQDGVWKRVRMTDLEVVNDLRTGPPPSSRWAVAPAVVTPPPPFTWYPPISAAHKRSLLSQRQQKNPDCLISHWSGRWSLPSVRGLGGVTCPPGLISNWSLTAVSAHMFSEEKAANQDRWLTAVPLISRRVCDGNVNLFLISVDFHPFIPLSPSLSLSLIQCFALQEAAGEMADCSEVNSFSTIRTGADGLCVTCIDF